MKYFCLVLSLFLLIGCNRDPNVTKRRYVQNGIKYSDKGKYKEAVILFKRALQVDMRYGPAYYQLGLTQLKMNQLGPAVAALRRAQELLPPGAKDRLDAETRLAELYLIGSRRPQEMTEVENITKDLLKNDPNSFDGHRLSAELGFVKAQIDVRGNNRDKAKEDLLAAIEEYKKANQIKPNQPNVVLALARTYAAVGMVKESEATYQGLIAANKEQFAAYTELYQLYTLQRRTDEAEKLLQAAIQANPKQYAFLTLMAAHYFSQNRRQDMLNMLNTIKGKAKDYPQAYVTVGDFYLRLGDGDEAIKQYQEGMSHEEKNKSVYRKRIIEVLMRQGKRGQAAEVNEAILKENPKDVDARGLAAALLLDKGDVNRAIMELQSVVNTNPQNFVAQYNLGRALAARGELEQARQKFLESIRLRPDYILPRLALAQIQNQKLEFDAALKTLDEVLRIDPNNMNAHLLKSVAYMGQMKFEDSRKLLEQMAKVNPNSADVSFQLGIVNLSEQHFKEAEDAFRKAYQLNPANSRGLMGIVETYMAQNKADQAMATLEAEANKSPNRIDLTLALGNTSVRAGKFDQAIGYYQKALSLVEPKSRMASELWLRIGETYRRKGDMANAIGSLQKAKDIQPDNATVVGTLALTLDNAGKKPEAKQAYEATLRVDPTNPVALNNLAFLMAENNFDLDVAMTHAQKAKQLRPDLYEISDTLGWIYLKKNLSDNAISLFADLVKKQPNHSTYHYHLAMALYQKGDKPKALQELNVALKCNPPKDEESKIREMMQKIG